MAHIQIKSPFFPRFLLKHLSFYIDKHSIIEDFEETFQEIVKNEGIFQARLWYWNSTFKSIPGYIKLIICWSFAMFKNYFKIALRNIQHFGTLCRFGLLYSHHDVGYG